MDLEGQQGPVSRGFKNWQWVGDVCPPVLLATGGLSHRFTLTCENGLPNELAMVLKGPINAADGLTIKVSKPWSYERNLGNLSTAIFIQRKNLQNVKTLAMKIQPKQSISICGIRLYKDLDLQANSSASVLSSQISKQLIAIAAVSVLVLLRNLNLWTEDQTVLREYY